MAAPAVNVTVTVSPAFAHTGFALFDAMATAESVGGATLDTVSVKVWLAELPTPLEATIVNANAPAWVGVPLSKPAEESVIPVGSGPLVLKLAAG